MKENQIREKLERGKVRNKGKMRNKGERNDRKKIREDK